MQTNADQALRLRFAAVDNVAPFNVGVDAVDINPVPEPSTWIVSCLALVGIGAWRLIQALGTVGPEFRERQAVVNAR